jgi:alkylation response protein AidB-like acyl-CoA dehydrogenase
MLRFFVGQVIVFAHVEMIRKHYWFYCENDASNRISMGEEEHKLGIRASSTRQYSLIDTVVPIENMLAGRGGLKLPWAKCRSLSN